jgi:acyl-CoA dehydrogenase
MNFDFSDEAKELADTARRFLTENCPPNHVRLAFDPERRFDRDLWRKISELGWLGTAIPEEYGGASFGYEGLCLLARELGRALAPIPFSSSVYLAGEAILLAGTLAQQRTLLPSLCEGRAIGTLAWAEGSASPSCPRVSARVTNHRLTGKKWPVIDGQVATHLVVPALDDEERLRLFLVNGSDPGVKREPLETIDPARDHATVSFDRAEAEPLGDAVDHRAILATIFDKGAALLSFEQIGGASACLDMSVAYARERHAFGRPIGSFQAIKHKLADVYVSAELARSNAYFAAWALSRSPKQLPLAASAARISSTEAFQLASRENIQTHGGIGYTWEMDCHLYYRRSRLLSLQLGGPSYWKDRLVTELERQNPAGSDHGL